MRLPIILRIIGPVLVIFAALMPSASAQSTSISLIRDAEIESTIRLFASPIFAAAGLDQSALQIHLVADPSLNAFVLGGQRIFINTGLLQRSEHPGQVIGVIAHETGHLAAGHLSRLNSELRNATVFALLSTVLGVAVGVIAEDAAVGSAVQSGGAQVFGRNILSFTRAMEGQADEAALRYLDSAQISSRGIAEFLAILGVQANRVVGVSPYVLTHPEPEARVARVQTHLALSRHANRPIPTELLRRHERMRAKLDGFLLPYEDVMRNYRSDDRSVGARYARAISSFRRGDLADSLDLIDGLLAESPNDPFFHETRGDALFQNGRIADAVASYRRAVNLAPDEPLLRIALAQALLETNRQTQLVEARDELRVAILREGESARAWRLLTIAYGRLGDQGNLALAQAETGFLTGDVRLAIDRANVAVDLLPVGSAGWLRAQDILNRINL